MQDTQWLGRLQESKQQLFETKDSDGVLFSWKEVKNCES